MSWVGNNSIYTSPVSNGVVSVNLPPNVSGSYYAIRFVDQSGVTRLTENWFIPSVPYRLLRSDITLLGTGNPSVTTVTPVAIDVGTTSFTASATVTSGLGVVNSGKVIFILKNPAGVIIGTPLSISVSSGAVSGSYTIPNTLPANSYTIEGIYQGGTNITGSLDSSHMLSVGGGGTGGTFPAGTAVIKATGAPNVGDLATPGTDYLSWSAGPIIYAAAYGTTCDPGNNSTDSTSSLVSAVNYILANGNGGTPTIFLPNCRIVVGTANPFIGVTSLRLIGGPKTVWVNTATTGGGLAQNFNTGPGYYYYQPRGYPAPSGTVDITSVPIATVASQSTVVTALTPSLVSTWVAGDSCLVIGMDQQGIGYPPNYRYSDRCTIKSVNTGTGAVTLVSPLKNSYNQNWYSVNSVSNPSGIKNLSKTGVSGGVSQLYPTTYYYIESIDFSQGIINSGNGQYSDVYAGGGAYIEFNKCRFANFVPSLAGAVVVRNSYIGGMEGDKSVDRLRIIDSTIGPGVVVAGISASAGTGIDDAVFDGVNFNGDVYWSAKQTTYTKCLFSTTTTYPWFISDYNGYYTQSLTVDSPIYKPNASTLYQIALGGSTSTVVAAPTSTTFTVGSGDWATLITEIGVGSNIYNSSTGALIATVADLYVNPSGGAFTISTVSAHGMTASQTFKVVSTQQASVRNPTLTTGNVRSLTTYDTSTGTLPQNSLDLPQGTGIVKVSPAGNSLASFADIAALFSGTASSTTYARGDGTWATPSGGGGGSYNGGPSGALCFDLSCVGGTVGLADIVTTVVPTKAGANTMTGVNKFSQLQVSLYTVSTLPTCNSSFEGQMEGVTDGAATPVYLATATGGGSVHLPVYCNGTNWVNH